MSKPSAWTVQRSTSPDDLETEILIVTRHEPTPEIRLEISAPDLVGAAGIAETRLARSAIKAAVNALQQALDSDALPGHVERFARRM